MIDENILIKILEEKVKIESCQDGVITYEGEIQSDGIVAGLRWAIDAVKEQPKTCEWIPVEKQLPETVHADSVQELIKSRYLVSSGDAVTEALYENGTFLDIVDFEPFGDVVAWMPLPEPREGEK